MVSPTKIYRGVYEVDDLTEAQLANKNLVPISKMNIQDGVLSVYFGDWEWWGKFDGGCKYCRYI